MLEELHLLITLQENHQRPSLTIESHCCNLERVDRGGKIIAIGERGRARQEWALLAEDSKKHYSTAIESLRNRLDFGRQALATQDFCHLRQEESKNVSDFIHRLDHTFKLAYGRDPRQEQPFSMVRCKMD